MSLINFRSRPMFPSSQSIFDNRIFDELFSKDRPVLRSLPAANVEESEDCFCIEMAIPGMPKEDIHVELEGDNLIVFAEKEESTEETKDYKIKEYSYSNFKRVFSLPDNVKSDVTAKYTYGVLKLVLPKKDEVITPKKEIEISS